MFGFVIFVVALILTLSAGKRARLVLGWGLGGAVVLGMLAALGFLGAFGLGAAGIGAGIGGIVGMVKAFHHAKAPARRSAFDATYSHDNLALNESRREVWVRDVSGQEHVLPAAEIRTWTHRWIESRGYKGANRIEFQTSRLDRPVVTAAFCRHRDTIWGAPKNAAECEEWHARLSAFLRS